MNNLIPLPVRMPSLSKDLGTFSFSSQYEANIEAFLTCPEKAFEQLMKEAHLMFNKTPAYTVPIYLAKYFYHFVVPYIKSKEINPKLRRNIEQYFYEQFYQYFSNTNEEEKKQIGVIFSLMKVELNLSTHWDLSKEIDIHEFSNYFYKDLLFYGKKATQIYQKLHNNDFYKLQYKTKNNTSLDLVSTIRLYLLNSTSIDIQKFHRLLNDIQSHYSIEPLTQNFISIINPSNILHYQLSLINLPELENTKFSYDIEGEVGDYLLSDIAKYNTMTKLLLAYINKNEFSHKVYGLHSIVCPNFQALCDNLHADPFLAPKIVTFMERKALKAKFKNKAIWLKYALDYKLAGKNQYKKRNKI